MHKISNSILCVRFLSTCALLFSRATPHKSHDAHKCLYLKCIGRRREARRRCLRCQPAYNGSGLPDRSLSRRRRLLSSAGGRPAQKNDYYFAEDQVNKTIGQCSSRPHPELPFLHLTRDTRPYRDALRRLEE